MVRVAAVVSIFAMMLLVLASICLPANVQIVNGFDEDVIDLTWLMVSMSVVPLVRLSLVNLLVHVSLFTQHEIDLVHWRCHRFVSLCKSVRSSRDDFGIFGSSGIFNF